MPPFLSTKRKSPPLHKAVQEHVLSLLPLNEAILEYPFPGHFADVAWPKMGIVFEIQCSPISLKEVKKRIEDYANLGYQVIWILHQKTFNKRLLSRSEMYLRTHAVTFFTNITAGGKGNIYDQKEILKGMIRTDRSPPFQVNVRGPFFLDPPKKRTLNILSLYDQLLFKLVRALNG